MQRNLKICIITLQYPPMGGGVGTACHRICTNLAKKGHEIHVIAPGLKSINNLSWDPIKPLDENGVIVHRTFPSLGDYMRDNPHEARAIGEYILGLHKMRNFDLIHAFFLTQPGLIAVNISKLTKIPVIASIRGSDIEILRFSPAHFSTIKWVLENADMVTGQSEEQLRKARAIAKIKIGTKTPSSVDETLFENQALSAAWHSFPWYLKFPALKLMLKKNRGTFLIGVAGYFRYQKGLEYLLGALKKLNDIGKKSGLIIMGDFISSEDLKTTGKLIKKLKLKGNIIFTGPIPHRYMMMWFKAIDSFVLPSRYEAMSNVLLEAMASGKPLVCANFDGATEVVIDGENALLAENESADSLAKKIAEIIDNEDLAKTLGQNAKKYIQDKHSPLQETQLWERIYKETLGSAQKVDPKCN